MECKEIWCAEVNMIFNFKISASLSLIRILNKWLKEIFQCVKVIFFSNSLLMRIVEIFDSLNLQCFAKNKQKFQGWEKYVLFSPINGHCLHRNHLSWVWLHKGLACHNHSSYLTWKLFTLFMQSNYHAFML